MIFPHCCENFLLKLISSNSFLLGKKIECADFSRLLHHGIHSLNAIPEARGDDPLSKLFLGGRDIQFSIFRDRKMNSYFRKKQPIDVFSLLSSLQSK